ncbi:hypothetical protein [Butyrivibrio sp.]|nr:hypothetical protein [Butyrivibrio sp.]
MIKVFISQPTNGLTEQQIVEERTKVVSGLYSIGYRMDEITIIDT